MFEQHPSAALEYWYFKLNAGPISLLVDWIARRRLDTAELRISVSSPSGREVLHLPRPDILTKGAHGLTATHTSCLDGEVTWSLDLSASGERVRPVTFPAKQLRLFDMQPQTAPDVTFNGWIEHRGARYDVVDARGMISGYWGRRLPREWWWLSANQFDTDLAIDANVLRIGAWGTRLTLPIAYLWWRDGARSHMLVAPPARIRASGTPEEFVVDARGLRGPRIRLVAKGRDYAELGDAIVNTLTGDLEVWIDDRLAGKAVGTAGLERRLPIPR